MKSQVSRSSSGTFLVDIMLVLDYDVRVLPKIGGFLPPKWRVYFMENPIRMDDLGAHPYF